MQKWKREMEKQRRLRYLAISAIKGKEYLDKDKIISLVEEKALFDLPKIGDKGSDFQEWWDTFQSLMSVVRPGAKRTLQRNHEYDIFAE